MISIAQTMAVSTVQIASQRVETSWQWYVIRAAGFVSAALLISLMISGIGQVTGLTYRWVEPIKAWALHKALAFALCAAIAVHVGFLLIDKFVPFNLIQILIPYQSHTNNGTSLLGMTLSSLAVTFGILAMYGVVVIVLSSLGWIDKRKHTWRWLHYLSYAVALLVFLHALYVGTDLRYGTFRTGWIILGGIVLLAIISRLRRAGSLSNSGDPD